MICVKRVGIQSLLLFQFKQCSFCFSYIASCGVWVFWNLNEVMMSMVYSTKKCNWKRVKKVCYVFCWISFRSLLKNAPDIRLSQYFFMQIRKYNQAINKNNFKNTKFCAFCLPNSRVTVFSSKENIFDSRIYLAQREKFRQSTNKVSSYVSKPQIRYIFMLTSSKHQNKGLCIFQATEIRVFLYTQK